MTKREIIIDGSEGEGGGQVLRTSLSLSAITGKPVRIENVRGKRKKPGLFRQHLTAFKAAAEICGAEVEGAELKSMEIAFHPRTIKGGDYDFAIGTAGSAMLVAQTILPILSFADKQSTAKISGGTHNDWAPTFDFFDQAFLPQFRAMGGRANAELSAHGFYPAGGGSIDLSIKPAETPARFELLDGGERQNIRAEILVSNIKGDVGVRELKTLTHYLGLAPEDGAINHVDSPGPGNVISVFLAHDNVTEVFTGLGKHGVRAEAIAKQVANIVQKYASANDASSDAKPATGEYLADQLLLPMALLGGGVFTTTDISQHTRTNMDIIRAFLPVEFKTVQNGRNCWTVKVAPLESA